MPNLKLDLVNNRMEIPNSVRVYDSLEDRKTSRGLGTKTLVKMSPNIIFKRGNERIQISKTLPVRLEPTKIDRNGRLIEIQHRIPKVTPVETKVPSPISSSLPSSPIATEGSLHSASRSLLLSRDGFIKTVLETGSLDAIEKGNSHDTEEEIEVFDRSFTDEEIQRLKRRKKFKKMQEKREREKEKEKEENYHPTLDIIRDKLYDDVTFKNCTIAARIKTRKLPGASWATERKSNSPVGNPDVGPGYYDIYKSVPLPVTVDFDIMPGREKVESVYATSDRIINNIENLNIKKDLEQFPLREKLRIGRQVNEMKRKYPHLIELKTKTFKNYIPPADYPILKPHSPRMTSLISNTERFDATFYRQENYVKTSGMKLGTEFDKQLDKRITFKFTQSSARKESSLSEGDDSTAGGLLNLNVEKYYSTEAVVAASPVKYSAAFKSSAKVGMQLPEPMTAPHIGPGAFQNAFKPAIEIKSPDKYSLAFMTYNPPFQRNASPDTFQRVKSFTETHRKGPIFSDEIRSAGPGEGRSRHLKKLVKEKMTRIYPRLATKKFSAEEMKEIQMMSESLDNKNNNNNNSSSILRMSSRDIQPLSRGVSIANLSRQQSTLSVKIK
jgi:DNA-binding protein